MSLYKSRYKLYKYKMNAITIINNRYGIHLSQYLLLNKIYKIVIAYVNIILINKY